MPAAAVVLWLPWGALLLPVRQCALPHTLLLLLLMMIICLLALRRSALESELRREGMPENEAARILGELEKRESDYTRLQVGRV